MEAAFRALLLFLPEERRRPTSLPDGLTEALRLEARSMGSTRTLSYSCWMRELWRGEAAKALGASSAASDGPPSEAGAATGYGGSGAATVGAGGSSEMVIASGSRSWRVGGKVF